jgi:osmotically-inducible protein OsmY
MGITQRRRSINRLERHDGPSWGAAALIGLAAGATGAVVAFIADPTRGRARRTRLADQGAAIVRRGWRRAGRTLRMIGSEAAGMFEARVEGGTRVGPIDDVTLRDRAESQLFRDPSVPKGTINLSVERGVLVLRGEVPEEAMRDRLVHEAMGIPGVWSVRNLLHLPGEPAETEAEERVTA